MPKSTNELARFQRKRRVSAMRLRGHSLDAIHYALSHGDGRFLNPNTGQPYDRATISRDIKEMMDATKAEIRENYETHKTRIYAELSEAKRSAWASNDINQVLKVLQMEMKLFGVEAPQVSIQITVMQELAEAIEDAGENPADIFQQMIQVMHKKKLQNNS